MQGLVINRQRIAIDSESKATSHIQGPLVGAHTQAWQCFSTRAEFSKQLDGGNTQGLSKCVCLRSSHLRGRFLDAILAVHFPCGRHSTTLPQQAMHNSITRVQFNHMCRACRVTPSLHYYIHYKAHQIQKLLVSVSQRITISHHSTLYKHTHWSVVC